LTELQVRIEAGPGRVGRLAWDQDADPEALERAIAIAADDALFGQGLRRLEVSVAGADRPARRAVLRAGFRLEGVRRQALEVVGGGYDDIYLFARLGVDQVGGPHGFSSVMNSALPRKRLIAHVLIRDDQGRVLLCETQFKVDWELPGGIVEPGESPRLGAIREVREELGVDRALGQLLVADWLPPYLGWDDATEMIFDGGLMSPTELPGLVLQPTEIRQVRFCTLAEAAPLVTPLAHRRLSVAAGLGPGQFAYLEDGVAV
jgi:8-oxo-dGTP pyrophosphatase MutT (NUDIX family)